MIESTVSLEELDTHWGDRFTVYRFLFWGRLGKALVEVSIIRRFGELSVTSLSA
jgi:hypothetical protein